MFVSKKPIWSKYPYGPARTRPYEHTVGPYEYTHTVRTVRVRSKYAYGLEHIYLEKYKGRRDENVYYVVLIKGK